MADGSRHSMYLAEETNGYGVIPSNPSFFPVRHNGTTLGLSKNTVQSEELRADSQIADYRHGSNQIGGDINSELSFSSFDIMLQAVTRGTWAVDTPTEGTDELKAGTERRSFMALRHFSDIAPADKPYHLFKGVEFNNLSLQVSPDAIVTADFSVVGQGMTTLSNPPAGSTFAPSTTTTPFDSFTGELKENGNVIAVITEIQLTLENGIEPRFVVGSKETIRPQIGRSNLSGQITAYFENSLLLDKFINETESSIEFTLIDAAGNEYAFTLPRIKYNGGQPDVSGQGAITLSMPFQALYDPATQTNISIERKAA